MSIRIDRLLADRGVGTRNQVKALMRRRRVQLDGVVVRDPSLKVEEDAVPWVDGEPLPPPPPVVVFHKPAGVLSTTDDPWGRATLATVLPAVLRSGYHPVGRLDQETTGLLLFSRDGQLTQRMLHPKRAAEREYVAEVVTAPKPELAEVLAAGVQTAEGQVSAQVVSIEGKQVRLIVLEGRHRMVRRMLNNAGYPVLALHRLRFGPFELGDLAVGEARPATEEEVASARGLEPDSDS